MSAGNEYFIVKFDMLDDRAWVVEGGQWMIQGHYLAVKQWTAQFNPSYSCFGHTIVWVRLSALNFLYYDERMLHVIAKAIGKPVKHDLSTAKLDQGNYARICV